MALPQINQADRVTQFTATLAEMDQSVTVVVVAAQVEQAATLWAGLVSRAIMGAQLGLEQLALMLLALGLLQHLQVLVVITQVAAQVAELVTHQVRTLQLLAQRAQAVAVLVGAITPTVATQRLTRVQAAADQERLTLELFMVDLVDQVY
jgi:hypothetical protein